MGLRTMMKRGLQFVLSGTPQIKVSASVYQLEAAHRLRGKNVIVTGGGSGLGFYIAKKCYNEGAMVLITGRNSQKLKNAAKEIGNKCKYLAWDMSEANAAKDFIDCAIEALCCKKIDCLVCNAGISLHEGWIMNVSTDSFDKQFDTNLKGNYFLSKYFIAHLLQQEDPSGNIIYVSSERGLYCDDLPYGLTKASLNSLTRGLARKYVTKGIRVNAVAPGVTASDMTGINLKDNLYRPQTCGKRVFLPEEVAEVVAFLLCDASKCISGEVIACDQGNYLRCDW